MPSSENLATVRTHALNVKRVQTADYSVSADGEACWCSCGVLKSVLQMDVLDEQVGLPCGYARPSTSRLLLCCMCLRVARKQTSSCCSVAFQTYTYVFCTQSSSFQQTNCTSTLVRCKPWHDELRKNRFLCVFMPHLLIYLFRYQSNTTHKHISASLELKTTSLAFV